ncbi:aspartate ammonia-lyase [Enteractinococcus helveticum]|uniref:aspartate ammonia-lyase n=1 Tax=Enteractinococcus helveticum TaxID=1837282 RepID=UPI000AA54901|nr:aspartate ammonia-lyase [Enteractinococcus helveticum]
MANHNTNKQSRIEVDGLGSVEVPSTAYWGASTQRALENFAISGNPLSKLRSLIWALGAIKKASAQANEQQGLLGGAASAAIQQASQEVMDGDLDEYFVIDQIQGGAGTSTNMNANEVIAHRASELLNDMQPGAQRIHALDHVNRSQSTNDVYPTALKLALLRDMQELKRAYSALADSFSLKAQRFSSILKVGRTQLQDAVPMTLGQEFQAFASSVREEIDLIDTFEPKLLETNLGGTAIGTGITSSSAYSESVISALSDITGLPITSSIDLINATSDASPFLTVSSALRRSAVKLSKISSDLRLLSSGPQAGLAEIRLPAVQPGSSIMPGKINPVIPEMVNQVAFHVIGADTTVTLAVEAGQLQLNAFGPIIAHSLLESLTWLTHACDTLRERCIDGIEANNSVLEERIAESVSIITALTPALGYMAAAKLIHDTLEHGGSVLTNIRRQGLLTEDQLAELLSIKKLTGHDRDDTVLASEKV